MAVVYVELIHTEIDRKRTKDQMRGSFATLNLNYMAIVFLWSTDKNMMQAHTLQIWHGYQTNALKKG